MNGILGYLRLDHAPVEGETFETMQQALSSWGADGSSSWREGPMALGCQYCFTLPEEKQAGVQPLGPTPHGWVLAASARLDNREELLAEIDIPTGEWNSIPDTHLIQHTYAHWGEDCVDHLLGDWSFALWDAKARKLFLARDHHGNTSLYYTQGSGFFAFASNKKPLLALPEVPQKLDLLRIAQVLTAWHGDGVRTAYEGILRLPPAHCLTVSNGSIAVRRYWHLEKAPMIHLAREEDYLEAFLEHYTRAVRSRLRSVTQVGVTLSGGLDSGSVSALAARELRAKGERLSAFTSVPLTDPDSYTERHRFGDEAPFAQATADLAGNIDTNWISAEEMSVLGGIERMLEIHDSPGHAAGNQFWICSLLETVHQRGMRVLLTGQGGNATVSWTGGVTSLLPSLWPWEWTNLVGEFTRLRERHGISPIHAIKRFILKPLLFPWVAPQMRSWRFWSSIYLDYSAIRPGFARSLNLDRLMSQGGHDPRFRTKRNPRAQRYAIVRPGEMMACALWGENSGAFGMEVRDPTLDKRLMEFCLGIPDEYYYAEGIDRAVLRRAFRDLLPDKVRLNRRRGLQAADVVERLQLQIGEIEHQLRQLERHPLAMEILDLPRMSRIAASLRQGPTHANTSDCGNIFLRGLGVGLFLLRF